MSNVNIKRAVENIRANTTVYTPIVEVVVNAIQAIDCTGRIDGEIAIRIHRSEQLVMDDGLRDIISIEIEDNGIGFTDENRESFDTLYGDLKINDGGKGFGRFTCLKYFENLHVDSIYADKSGFKHRKFAMGKEKDIIVDETVSESTEQGARTIVHLGLLKPGKSIDKKLNTIARNLVEKLLPYFISEGYICPKIGLYEKDGTGSIQLNESVTNELSAVIKEIPIENGAFTLAGLQGDEDFRVRVFKLYFPKNHKSKISLVADKREVSGSPIHNYIPEFIDDFYDRDISGNNAQNYIIKAYVFGSYLDRNVSLERGGFEFDMESDFLYGIPQADIERKAANIAKTAVGLDIAVRQEKKKERVQSYVDKEAPWHKSMINKVDLTRMPYKPSNEEIEALLQKEKFTQEAQIKRDVANLLADSNPNNLKEKALEVVSKISGTSKSDLIHYIALRKGILDIFDKSLQTDESGAYSSEGVVHDIIFPRKGNSDITTFEDHNLWILDERLNFTSFVHSDRTLNDGNLNRPDLLVYDKRVLFRGDNETSNPVMIFEFKKPQRDNFADFSSKDDPVRQIVRYVNAIQNGDFKTPEGRKINVAKNTPFYGYIVCDLTTKIENWLETEQEFTPMPDRAGWFQWRSNINLYVEVISWDKVLRDAKMRNAIFFHKLGI